MTYNITTDFDIKPLFQEAGMMLGKLRMPKEEKVQLAGLFVAFVIESLENDKNTESQNRNIKDVYHSVMKFSMNLLDFEMRRKERNKIIS